MAGEKTHATTPRGSDEVQPLLSRQTAPKYRAKTALIAALAVLATLSVVHRLHLVTKEVAEGNETDGDDESTPWSWAGVKPSRDLVWENCYNDTLECARLDVPMDWLDPTDEERVILGVVKRAAQTQKNLLPPIFVNPGGPGGSGIQQVEHAGIKLQAVIGDNQDIISFDPRGVGVSTPRMECWGNSQKRQMWGLQETPMVDERPGLAYDDYARKSIYSGVCEEAMNSTGIMRHLSSASIARDMLEILEKTGHKKLRYWGSSYGTILGGVFAGMYPDRVERLVSDGNVDYTAWFQSNHLYFSQDADKLLDAFDAACHKAGPEKCALWAPSPSAVQKRRSDIVASLKTKPVVIPAWARETGPEIPQLVTYSKLQLVTRTVAYEPLAFAEELARVYAALEAGDGVPFYDLEAKFSMIINQGGYSQMCNVEDVDAAMPLPTGMEMDAFPAIVCSDGAPLEDSPEKYAEYTEDIQGVSRWLGAANVLFRSACIGRTVRPKWRFTDEDFQGDTAFPILYVNNIVDNITPMESARNNSARFPSSVLLTQNAYGHCSSAAPSVCTSKHIRAYFQEGILPPPGTACDPDYDLFEKPSEEDLQQLDEFSSAVAKLAETAGFTWMSRLV